MAQAGCAALRAHHAQEFRGDEPMKTAYLCYLLRIWRANGQDSAVRALLEDPSSREVVGFASLQDLFSYLEEKSSDLEHEPCTARRIPDNDWSLHGQE
jgi:hypothetical protein